MYGEEVHHELTSDLVKEVATELGSEIDKEKLAGVIAAGDLHVDEAYGVLDPVVGCNICHFHSYTDSEARVLAAIPTKNLYLFGATLHLYQDYWSHWHEGYDTVKTIMIPVTIINGVPFYVKFEGYEHLTHSVQQSNLGFFKDLASSFGERSPDTLTEFFESHPREIVRTVIGYRNPRLSLSSLTDDTLIDLYLRNEFDYYPKDLLFAIRSQYKFNPDRYVKNSWRDKQMTHESKRAIKYFLGQFRFICGIDEIDWTIPEDSEIRSLLTGGKPPLGTQLVPAIP